MGVWLIYRIKCPRCNKFGYSSDKKKLENGKCHYCSYPFKGDKIKAETFKEKEPQKEGNDESSG